MDPSIKRNQGDGATSSSAEDTPGIIDLLFPLWDEKRQTIHDKAASSVVVEVPS